MRNVKKKKSNEGAYKKRMVVVLRPAEGAELKGVEEQSITRTLF